MVIPGVTTRNRLTKRGSRGLVTLFSVCHAISIAITTVLPEPVAIFSATRGRPALCSPLTSPSSVRQSRITPYDVLRPLTSARKIAVSAASRWAKRTGLSRSGSAQYSSSLRLVGVTPSYRRLRQTATSPRSSSIKVFLTTCSWVRVSDSWTLLSAPFARPLRTGATGMYDSLGLRESMIVPVGPAGPISKWRVGTAYGGLMIGLASGSTGTASRSVIGHLSRVESRSPEHSHQIRRVSPESKRPHVNSGLPVVQG